MSERPDQHDPQLPPALQRRLGELYRSSVNVPREIDDAILSAGRRRLGNVRRFRMLLRWGGAAAAAALISMAVWLPSLQRRSADSVAPEVASVRPSPGQAPYTILDAYRVARSLQSGQKPDARWDLDHDGTVDQKDVDLIAQEAVRLQ